MRYNVDEHNIEISLKKNIRTINSNNKNRVNCCNKISSKYLNMKFKYIINFCCENLQR